MAKKTKEEILRHAREAKRLLEDESFQEVLAEIQQEIFDDFRTIELADVDELVAVQARQVGVDAVRRRLRILVESGVVAEKTAK
jgi:predicted ArsR family transcriptional regulator